MYISNILIWITKLLFFQKFKFIAYLKKSYIYQGLVYLFKILREEVISFPIIKELNN